MKTFAFILILSIIGLSTAPVFAAMPDHGERAAVQDEDVYKGPDLIGSIIMPYVLPWAAIVIVGVFGIAIMGQFFGACGLYGAQTAIMKFGIMFIYGVIIQPIVWMILVVEADLFLHVWWFAGRGDTFGAVFLGCFMIVLPVAGLISWKLGDAGVQIIKAITGGGNE
jgi:hypothetical protein